MLNQPHIAGPLPDVDPAKFTIGAAWEEHFSHETMIFLGWLVRAEYAEISAIRIVAANATSTSVEVQVCWEKPLDEVFASTDPAPDTPLDNVLDALTNRFERPDYLPPRPPLMDSASHSRFQSCAYFTVQKPKAPARPRGADWVSRRLRQEMKTRGYDYRWPQAAFKNFQMWLDLDGKDIHIVRPRDLSEEPLPRRFQLRKQNGKQTESSPGVDCPLCVNERVASRRRRVVARRKC